MDFPALGKTTTRCDYVVYYAKIAAGKEYFVYFLAVYFLLLQNDWVCWHSDRLLLGRLISAS